MEEITSLRDRLREKEREMEEVTRSWQERLRQSEEWKQEEARLLEVGGGTLAYTGKYFTLWKAFFSSPEHKVLRVSYCDRPLSVVLRRA